MLLYVFLSVCECFTVFFCAQVVGVVVMINKRSFGDGSVSVFTSMDEKVRTWRFSNYKQNHILIVQMLHLNVIVQVLSNHMDVLGMVLDNVQLYESSRQEAKRSQVTLSGCMYVCICMSGYTVFCLYTGTLMLTDFYACVSGLDRDGPGIVKGASFL